MKQMSCIKSHKKYDKILDPSVSPKKYDKILYSILLNSSDDEFHNHGVHYYLLRHKKKRSN